MLQLQEPPTHETPSIEIPKVEAAAEPKSLGRVSNQHSIRSASYRIALVGECPTYDDVAAGKPFSGQPGKFLDQVLANAGILRDACLLANVVQECPNKQGELSRLPKGSSYYELGRFALASDLQAFSPNVCLLLGKAALFAALGTMDLDGWKCSFFIGTRYPFEGRKCIATYRPHEALKLYAEHTPWITFAAHKAKAEGHRSELVVPHRVLKTNPSYEELVADLDKVLLTKCKVSADIEGGIDTMSCCSFATSPTYSFIVPFAKLDGDNWWAEEWQEVEIWRRFVAILSDPAIEKVFQYGTYDRSVIHMGYQLIVKAQTEDTILKWHELYAELPKDLGSQTSIMTEQPYYKWKGKKGNKGSLETEEDQQQYFEYCCLDSAVTYEIHDKLVRYLDHGQLAHYRRNVELLNPLLYMALRGMKYDSQLAKERLHTIQDYVHINQFKLDTIAREHKAIVGLNFLGSNSEILAEVRTHCCNKTRARDKFKVKKRKGVEISRTLVRKGEWVHNKGYEDYPAIATRLEDARPLDDKEKGWISVVCETTMNTKSPKFKAFLYGKEFLKLPTQYKKDPKTKEMKPTTDYLSLLKLFKKQPHPVLKISCELSQLRTRAQALAIAPYKGRMFASYNLVGTETGRIACSKSILISDVAKGKRVGANLTTIPNKWDLGEDNEEHPLAIGMRDLFLADEGCYIAKCDLKGADGWTIGAYLAHIGEPTMLEDLRFGLKPAQIVALEIMTPGCTRGKSRPELKEMCATVGGWQYFVSKCLIWGYCYTLGPIKAAELVFIESEGKHNLNQTDIKKIFYAIEQRYHPTKLHRWMEQHMASQSYPAKLVAPNGLIRKFFSRNFGSRPECLGEALSHLPQVVTTHTINSAMYKCWTDPDNRIESGLRIEPLHSVHDELVVQWRIEDTEWAKAKIKEWFDNPIVIAGQTITIPYDGSYGLNWSMDGAAKIGTL